MKVGGLAPDQIHQTDLVVIVPQIRSRDSELHGCLTLRFGWELPVHLMFCTGRGFVEIVSEESGVTKISSSRLSSSSNLFLLHAYSFPHSTTMYSSP